MLNSGYIERKLKETGIKIEENAVSLIASKSEGHPYVLVSMCYAIIDSMAENEKKITEETVKTALPKIYNDLAKDFFAPMFHPLTPKAKEVLLTLARSISGKEFSFSEAVNRTNKEANYLSPYIKEMLRKGVLNKPERGRYAFFHILFVEYLRGRGEDII
ncbi:MAG: hypothetical protein HY761_10465 [Candidatus Omnitrophica bacterium]|nr:hypothetical protein [Candidatus Omnitrophota bacterium]